MNLSQKFEVRPTDNGGLVVVGAVGVATPFEADMQYNAAFTTPADMISWLAEQYGLNSHPTPIVTVKAIEPEWTDWSGGAVLPVPVNRPCMIRMRNGSERVGKTRDNPHRWDWSVNPTLSDFDVIAYRLV
ncbi:hypothetical protein [Ensifer aridi]|uniref:hypothetical protein n=1 Tax=Ensifer aridi TaxID=1708715 RepID=UPI001124F1A2|nr:hypothetical protein [Ensifer aridi]